MRHHVPVSDTTRIRQAAGVILDAVSAALDDDSAIKLGQHDLDVMGDRLIEVGAVMVSRNPMTGHVNVDASTLSRTSVFIIGYLAARLADISGVPVDAAIAEVRLALEKTPET
jgi:hypothetical protein